MDTFFQSLSIADITIIAVSMALLLLAKPLISWLNSGRSNREHRLGGRVGIMRTLNALIMLAVLLKAFIRTQFPELASQSLLSRVVEVLITVYFTALLIQVVHYIILRRFGKRRDIQDKITLADTYSSRALSLFAGVFIAIIALIMTLKGLGLNSWLEASGVLGIIGLFLAMTQSTWAPDLLSGLIILNSRLCEEGDVVQLNLNGKDTIASVFKTKFFHTEFLELANNHRLMIRNAKVRDCDVHNLSRFASARGLRECLCFNIGYEHSQASVTAMFERAITQFDEAEEVREEQFMPEIRILETGDYAVTWGLFYYTKNIKSVLSTRQLIRSYILDESIKSNISLATPQLHQMQLDQTNSV